MSPTLFTENPAHTKHPLYSMSHFLEGVYLSGGTPLVDLVECLGGVGGTLDVAPLTVGWGASVEMIGSVLSPTLLPLSTVVGVVTLVIGVTGYFTNFAAPINCCRCGHTCHWCNRQH